MLACLMGTSARTAKDLLPVFGTRGRVSEVLSGKRSTSKEQAKKLASLSGSPSISSFNSQRGCPSGDRELASSVPGPNNWFPERDIARNGESSFGRSTRKLLIRDMVR
jgi:hypothetical protein